MVDAIGSAIQSAASVDNRSVSVLENKNNSERSEGSVPDNSPSAPVQEDARLQRQRERLAGLTLDLENLQQKDFSFVESFPIESPSHTDDGTSAARRSESDIDAKASREAAKFQNSIEAIISLKQHVTEVSVDIAVAQQRTFDANDTIAVALELFEGVNIQA